MSRVRPQLPRGLRRGRVLLERDKRLGLPAARRSPRARLRVRLARGRDTRAEPLASSRLLGDGRRMSDFLKSLVARQLGAAPVVRPRLPGRFAPPPDACASEAHAPAARWDEPDADALELSIEVETRPTHARDAAHTRDDFET